MMLARWLKEHLRLLKAVVFIAAAGPGAWLMYAWYGDALGANPLATLTATTGRAALVLLAASLSVTPLRRWLSTLSKARQSAYGKRIADWNFLVKLRRPLGLWSFFYASLHLLVYLEFDALWSAAWFWQSVLEKPYMLVGLLAWVLLIPLAATSPMPMMRRMGRHWLRLHRSVYLVAILSLLHFWWLAKPGTWDPWPETFVLTILLGYRLMLETGLVARWSGSDGLESPERRD
jgi:sulfoxide reductase heme-binding subunit YedZ